MVASKFDSTSWYIRRVRRPSDDFLITMTDYFRHPVVGLDVIRSGHPVGIKKLDLERYYQSSISARGDINLRYDLCI